MFELVDIRKYLQLYAQTVQADLVVIDFFELIEGVRSTTLTHQKV